ncbi:MAG: pitrilysin family protein [Candidatus Hydrothermales bacterium]
MKKIVLITILLSTRVFSEILLLENNIPLIYKKIEGIEVISCGVLFRGGVAKYTEGMDGIENFSLNALLEGTKSNPYPQLHKVMTKYGIQSKVITEHDFSVLILKSPSKNYKKVIEILFEIFSEPELKPDRVNSVKTNILLKLKRKEEDPDQKLFRLLNNVFYKNHPYIIEHDGKVETVSKFKIEDIKEFLKKNFKSGNIILGFIGPIEKDEVYKLLNEKFGKIEKSEDLKIEIKEFLPKDTFFHIVEKDFKTTYIASKFPLPEVTHSDYPILLALSEILSTRLEEKIRTKEGLSYSVFAGLSLKKKNYGYFYVSSSLPDSAFKFILKEIENLKKISVKREEIIETFNIYKTLKYLQNSSTDLALLNMLKSYILTEKENFLDDILHELTRVKPEEIKRCANTYLKNFTIIRLGP